MIRLWFILGAFVVWYSEPVNAAEVSNKITCELPTTRTNGESLSASDIKTITAYTTRCDGTTVKIESQECSLVDTFEMPEAVCENTYRLTATDLYGMESVESQPVTVTNIVPVPSPPSGITVEVVVKVGFTQ